MTEAQEVRARAKALRERREELEKALAGAAGPGARPLRLELARVKEELVDCARRLKELMPSHKVRCRTTWAGVDGWQWDRFQYQTWAELEGAGEQDGPTELDRMRLAVRLARERAETDKQGEYLAQGEGGKKAAQVAREAGRHRGTVSRTVGRGRTKIAKEAKALYEVLQAQQGPGPLVVELADGRVREAVRSLLTPRQQLYLYLYYGEWLSLREIGRLLRVDHASVLRSIRCGLERLGTLAVGTRAEVRGLEELEERLMAHFNQLEPPEEALRPRPKAPVRAPAMKGLSSTALQNTTSLAQPRESWSLVASAVSVTILPISSTASMSMPVLVEPTLTELHTRSVWDSAWGMERIRFLSALVMPLLTRAE